MSAFFSTFVANEPDEDGDIGFDTELTVTNESETPIYQVQYKIWYRDPEGATFEESDSCDDVFLSQGDSHTISPWGRVNQRDLSGDTISVTGQVKLARRDFCVLGEVEIPGPGSSARLSTNVSFDWFTGPITLLVTRSEPDSDGDFNLEFKALIENQSSQYLKVVNLKGQLVDAEGVEIANDETEREIPAQTAVHYSSSFYNTKAGQLVGAKGIFSLKALVPVVSFEASETTQIGEE
jgi:hypothetical protein